MATGDSHLALERVDASDSEGRALVGRFLGVSLEVADIFATHKLLVARGVPFVAPPEKQPWGPDGNILTLVGNGD